MKDKLYFILIIKNNLSVGGKIKNKSSIVKKLNCIASAHLCVLVGVESSSRPPDPVTDGGSDAAALASAPPDASWSSQATSSPAPGVRTGWRIEVSGWLRGQVGMD